MSIFRHRWFGALTGLLSLSLLLSTVLPLLQDCSDALVATHAATMGEGHHETMAMDADAHAAHTATEEPTPAPPPDCDNCDASEPRIDCCAHDQVRLDAAPLLADRGSVKAMNRAVWDTPIALAWTHAVDWERPDQLLSAYPVSPFSVLRL